MTAPQQPPESQDPPRQLAPPEPPAEEGSSLIPALLLVYATYLLYRGAHGSISRSWRRVALDLGLVDLAGGALSLLAASTMNRLRIDYGRAGDELMMQAGRAAQAGVDAGLQMIAEALIWTDQHGDGDPVTKDMQDDDPTQMSGFVPTNEDPPDLLAQMVANAVRDATVMAAAGLAGWSTKVWHCLPGDTEVVAVGVKGATRHWYEGDLIRMRTADGRRVSMTPEHLVLTCTGWAQAQFVQPGQHLFAIPSVEPVITPEVQRPPAQIGKVVDALYDLWASRRLVSVLVDFNVNQQSRDTDVAVVPANSELRDAIEPGMGNPLQDLNFVGADVSAGRLLAQRHCVPVGGGLFPPPHRIASLNSPLALDLRAFVGDSCKTGGGLASQGNVSFAQDAGDGRATSSERPPERSDRRPSGVKLDQVVDIEVVPTRCHVYDLVTVPGLFLANELLVHNSQHDERVRDTHRELDGQARDLGNPFVSPSGAKLRFPHDPLAPIAEVANCRCFLSVQRR